MTRESAVWWSSIASVALALAVSGCSSLPQDGGVQQQLDERTGITVTRLAKPLELTVTASPGPANDPFAYLSPFQTNRMGERADFLWLAVPANGALLADPVIRADGEIVTVGELSNSPTITQLEFGPYQTPAPWSRQFFANADDAVMQQLAKARRVEIMTRDASGEWTFVLEGDALRALAKYAETR